MPNHIIELVNKLESTGGRSLSVVIMLGDPDFETTFELVQIAVDQGVDIVELGIPSVDPFLDSPVMRQSMQRALACSSDPQRYLDAIGEVRRRHPALPIEVMIYRDTLEQIGLDAYCQALNEAGVDATLVADIADVDEAYRRKLDGELLKRDIISLRFVPHPFRPDQVDDLKENGRGFIIVQTTTDASGGRPAVRADNRQTLDALRRAGISLPLIMAYGIKTPEHVRQCMALGADGVLIGTVVLDTAHRCSRGELKALLYGLREAAAPE